MQKQLSLVFMPLITQAIQTVRPEFIEAFANMARLAAKFGVEGKPLKFETPLLHLSKASIIRLGIEHGVDYSQTVSCYQADDQGIVLAVNAIAPVVLRKQGFADEELQIQHVIYRYNKVELCNMLKSNITLSIAVSATALFASLIMLTMTIYSKLIKALTLNLR